MKKTIRLTENEFRGFITNVINEVLTEWGQPTHDVNNVNSIWFYKKIYEAEDEEEEVTYDIQCLDIDDNTLFYEDNLDIDELTDMFGDDIAAEMEEIAITPNKEYRITDILYRGDGNINLNNPDEVDKEAVKFFKPSEYHKGSSGYILRDGSVINFGDNKDHISINSISGIGQDGNVHDMTVGKFVSLGNIRIRGNSISMEKQPTPAQARTLIRLFNEYEGEGVYIDFCHYDDGQRMKEQYSRTVFGGKYDCSEPRTLMNKINRYFNEGIRIY